MDTLAGFANSFVSGELAPTLDERTDLAQHRTGCSLALNFVGLVEGPNASRPGFVYRGAPKHHDKPQRLIPWRRADGEALVLELGDEYARVWTASGAQVQAIGGPYEFVQPYTAAQLDGVRFRQVGDLAYVTHREGLIPQQFTRFADTYWTCAPIAFDPPPWQAKNLDPDKVMTLAEITSGVWSIEANYDVFAAGHVGSFMLIGASGGFPGVPSWAPDTAVPANQWRLSNGRVYESLGAGTTGNTAPRHEIGDVSDGGVTWRFRHDGAGMVRIDEVTDARHAVLNVPKTIPILTTGESTTAFSFAAFSNVAGWPTAWSAVREERLIMAATLSAPSIIQASRSYGFNPLTVDFKPGLGTDVVMDDDAASTGVGGERARIVWMVDAAALVVGAVDGEYLATGGTVDDPISPSGFIARRISGHGSADVEPVVLEGPPAIVMHVARTGTTLREIVAGADQAQEGRDLSVLAQHICGKGIVGLAWTQPDNILWVRLADDSLAAFTYHREHNVIGWRRQEIAGGWKVEDLCAAPDAQGRDRLHVAAYRTKGGATQRAHLVLHPRPNYQLGEQGLFLDAAEEYSGAPTTTLSGLDHLAGETVAVVGDGAYLGPFTVSGGGSVSLPVAVSHAWCGLIYRRRFCSLPFDPTGTGDMLGRVHRPTQGLVILSCVEADVWAGTPDDADPPTSIDTRVRARQPANVNPTVRKVQDKVTFKVGAERENRQWVGCDAPFDVIIHALRPVINLGSS